MQPASLTSNWLRDDDGLGVKRMGVIVEGDQQDGWLRVLHEGYCTHDQTREKRV